MRKLTEIPIADFVKWVIYMAMAVYLLIFVVLLIKGGFTHSLLGIRISVSSPLQIVLILMVLALSRVMIGIGVKNAVLMLAALGLSALVSEGVLRILDPPMARESKMKQWRRPSEILGWQLVPLLKGKGNVGADVRINSHGLRDVERPWKKPEGVCRILALGDSFTYGYGLNLKDCYVKRLQRLFDRDKSAFDGIAFDVINAGVPMYNLYQSLTYFGHYGSAYQPDLVVYFCYMDDVGGPYGTDEVKGTYRALQQSDEFKETDTFLSKIYFANLVTNSKERADAALRPFITAQWLKSIEKRKEYIDGYNRYWSDQRRVARFKKHLLELKAVVESKKAAFLVVLLPDAVQVNSPAEQAMNRLLKEFCTTHGIPYLDITPVFEKQPDIRSLYLFPVDAHTSAKGDALVAETVYEKITADRLLQCNR